MILLSIFFILKCIYVFTTGFTLYKSIAFALNKRFSSSFPTCISYISFSYLITLTRNSSTYFLIPNFNRKDFSISLSSKTIAIFFCMCQLDKGNFFLFLIVQDFFWLGWGAEVRYIIFSSFIEL